jgi:ubiquinone/menaquinone biosynthesis C-methylase UbiE
MAEINLLDRYPRSNRPIDARATIITEEVRTVARQYGRDFFDGDRLYGYGGYTYHPKFWTDTVARLRDHYGLASDARILDVGCAKGFTMYDFKRLMPEAEVLGLDISQYARDTALPEVKDAITVGDCASLPWPDKHFDLVISINTVHNLPRAGCIQAIREIERVSRGNSFLTVDAWRTDEERERLLRWMLTAYTYMHVDDWKKLFAEAGYTGDYWWFFA